MLHKKLWNIRIQYGYDNEFLVSLDTEKVTKYSRLIMLDLGKYNLKKLTKYDKDIEKYMKKITKLNNAANFWKVFTPEEDERYIRNTTIAKATNLTKKDILKLGK